MKESQKSTEAKSKGIVWSLFGRLLLAGLMLFVAAFWYHEYTTTARLSVSDYVFYGQRARLALLAFMVATFGCFGYCIVSAFRMLVGRAKRGCIVCVDCGEAFPLLEARGKCPHCGSTGPESLSDYRQRRAEEKGPGMSEPGPAPQSGTAPRPSGVSSLLRLLSKSTSPLAGSEPRPASRRKRRPAPSAIPKRHRRRSAGG
jgi:hypothetical protein